MKTKIEIKNDGLIFNMFTKTHHAEIVVKLVKKQADIKWFQGY